MNEASPSDAAAKVGYMSPDKPAAPGERPLWRRKTAEELAQEQVRSKRRQRFNPFQAGPLIVGIVIGSIPVAVLLEDREGDGRWWWLALIISFCAFFTVGFLGGYFFQILGTFSPQAKTPRLLICTSCQRIALPSRFRKCPCGGAMEDAHDWTLARCPKCQYDLRGTPDRCPECGTVIPAGEPAAP